MDFSVPTRDLPVSHPVAEAPLCGDVSGGVGGGEMCISPARWCGMSRKMCCLSEIVISKQPVSS